MLLAKFEAISFDNLSIITTLVSIIVTTHNTFITSFSNGGNLMTTVFSMVGHGVYEVTIQTISGNDNAVSM